MNIWIRSAVNSGKFANSQTIFMRMDATPFGNTIGGKVNCQAYAVDTQPTINKENWEVVELVSLSNPGVFAIQSTANHNTFLRMDAAGLTQANPIGGTVNCQFTMSQPTFQNTGVFQIVSIPNSPAFALCLANSPNVFLRVDGSSMSQWAGNGGGTVNCQFSLTPPQWNNGTIEDPRVLYISGLFP
jgi:hypothetical protein